MKWLVYGGLFVLVWYVFRKVEDQAFTAIDKRIYPQKV